ncbi:hypothetical protein [Thalassovita sp.]|uniref:hypothetical protein n=1 Tax=Thalassovita sp. TaxID=1979401 RepID=UPI0029DE7E6A|nr:hypothetical protein [Thalassovita sp.]
MSKKASFSALVRAPHLRAVKALGYALTLGGADAWADLAFILANRLTPEERAGLAYAALRGLPEDVAYQTATLAIFGVFDGEAVA